MVHVPAKLRENTSMRFWVTVWELNVTDRQTDGQTETHRQTDGGHCNISRPGPSAPQEIKTQCQFFIYGPQYTKMCIFGYSGLSSHQYQSTYKILKQSYKDFLSYRENDEVSVDADAAAAERRLSHSIPQYVLRTGDTMIRPSFPAILSPNLCTYIYIYIHSHNTIGGKLEDINQNFMN